MGVATHKTATYHSTNSNNTFAKNFTKNTKINSGFSKDFSKTKRKVLRN
jgi:hypothetical protein